MNTLKLFLCVVALVGLLGLPARANAQSGGGFVIESFTIDSGGPLYTYGGDFELAGTIGQPNAYEMAGGDFQLQGGFWVVPDFGLYLPLAFR